MAPPLSPLMRHICTYTTRVQTKKKKNNHRANPGLCGGADFEMPATCGFRVSRPRQTLTSVWSNPVHNKIWTLFCVMGVVSRPATHFSLFSKTRRTDLSYSFISFPISSQKQSRTNHMPNGEIFATFPHHVCRILQWLSRIQPSQFFILSPLIMAWGTFFSNFVLWGLI